MKKTHIILILIIALGVGAVISTIGDASTYVTFDKADKNLGKQYTVIGYLDKEAPREYNPQTGLFTFTAIDKAGEKREVIFNEPEPQDFERSEEITLKGYATDSHFVAEQILMKCPSKYNENNQIEESEGDNVYYE